MNIKDVRQSLTRHSSKTYRKRPLKAITDIVIHHSATTTGSAEGYANYHVNHHGWPGIGYHYVIEQDGEIKFCNDHNVISYHAGNANGYTLGVCVTGDFTQQEPTKEQEKALGWLINEHLPKLKVNAHRDMPGANTSCPGKLDYQKIIADHKPKLTTLYKVQVGAFANKANADRLAAELKNKGYATYIVEE